VLAAELLAQRGAHDDATHVRRRLEVGTAGLTAVHALDGDHLDGDLTAARHDNNTKTKPYFLEKQRKEYEQ
jgi:hypothetical protein